MESSTPSGLTIVGQSARSIAQTLAPASGPSVHSLAAPSGMSLPPVQPWRGWPSDWALPPWDGLSPLFGQYVSTVYTCVDLLARSIGSFPTYRMRGDEHLPPTAWMLNPEPALYSSWIDFAKQLVDTIYLRGEGIVYALARYRDDDSIARMCVLNPDTLTCAWEGGEIVWRIGQRVIDGRDLCQIKYQTWPGILRGVTPLQWIGRNLLAADAMERYQAELAQGGGIPWGVLTAPGNLTAAQADENRARWIEASARRSTAPVMLGGGLTLDTLTLSPTDMALLDLRIFDEQRICAAFGVPPYLVGLPQAEGLTYANATSLFDYFWRSTLRPKCSTIAQALSAWALPAGQRLEFNADEFTRPDFAARVQAYAQLHAIYEPETSTRAITVQEIRSAERLTTDDGTDAAAILAARADTTGGAT